eukprot:jgi/Mesvir1/6117/Mv25311-RA.1
MRLLEAAVNPVSTLPRYKHAVLTYIAWAPSGYVDLADAETLFCEWISAVYNSNCDGRGCTLCQHAKSGLQLYYPDIVGQWKRADRMLAGWGRLVLPVSPPPMPWSLCYFTAVLLLSRGHARLGALLIIAFQQYLRISEALGLRVGDVALPGDPRLGPSDLGHGALLLRDHKTAQGSTQHVIVREDISLGLLGRLVAGRAAAALVFGGLGYTAALREWDAVLAHMGIAGMFTFHSLRHGGATHDAVRGVSAGEIQLRGRWRSARSVAHYVGLHRALLNQSIPASLWGLVARWDPVHWRQHFAGRL